MGKNLQPITLTNDAGESKKLLIMNDEDIQDLSDEGGLVTGGGQGKYGDFEPRFAHIEQRDWSGGRGQEDFSDDPTRYFDSLNMWTPTPGTFMPSLFWNWVHGLRNEDYYWFTEDWNVWGQERGSFFTTWEYGTPFTANATYNAKHAYIMVWVPITGYSPGDPPAQNFTVKIRNDSTGSPGTVVQTSDTIDIWDVATFGDFAILKFTFSTPASLTAANDYWFCVETNSIDYMITDNDKTATAKSSDDSWSTETADLPKMYFRLTDADEARYLIPFEHHRAQMAIAVYEDGTNSKLYMEGDRGKATAGSGASITDSNEGLRGAWTADQWIGAWVWIIDGTGEGQRREITDSDSSGVIAVSPNWDVTPDATSQYIIYNTNDWFEVDAGGTGLTSVKNVIVANNVIYFAQGYGVNIRRARWDSTASPPAMGYDDDGTNDADAIDLQGNKIVKATNDDGRVMHAKIKSWGTDLTFKNLGEALSSGYNFTNLLKTDKLYAFREDGIYYYNNGPWEELPINLRYMPLPTNGQAVVKAEQTTYFNWSHSIQAMAGQSVTDINPNRDAGLPDGRQGPVSAMTVHPAGVFYSIDAGSSGESSVAVWDGRGHHEVLRIKLSGIRVRSLMFRSAPEVRPRLTIGFGGELIYQTYPLHHMNPSKDSGALFVPHGYLVTSVIDMGNKSLKKLFKDIEVVSEGASTTEYYYQADDDIGTNTWKFIGDNAIKYNTLAFSNPDLATINALSNVKELRIKASFIQQGSTTNLPINTSLSVKGVGRTPVKHRWPVVIDLLKPVDNQTPKDLLDWLETQAESAKALLMNSDHPLLDAKTVFVYVRRTQTQAILDNDFIGNAYVEILEV